MISIGAPFPQPCLVIVSVAPEMPMGGYPALAPMAIAGPAASCAVGILPIVSKRGVSSSCCAFAGGSTLARRRTDPAHGRMPALLVVEHLDVIEQLHLRLAVAVEPFAELALHRREERFHDGVVVAVPAPTHAADNTAVGEEALIVLAGVRGEFNWSLQQLYKEKLQWVLRHDVGLIARGAAPSVHQVVRRRDVVNIDNSSGRPSRAVCRAGMRHSKPAYRNRLEPGGSARLAACHQAT